ncbi:MAG: hypothetical protein EOP32_12445 [Rhodococcus sp. (in: high G+C Gram-positive bacteria)]|nr:MAG: hypothetical protein EOP32_12445 [Rhodococcus sp. (in: high G+C Gram-positive bacteria)]
MRGLPNLPSSSPSREPMPSEASNVAAGHGDGCFGCGPDNPIGLGLRCTAGPGFSLRTFVVPASTKLRCSGTVSFGITSAILEESMGLLGGLVSQSLHAEHLSVDCENPVDAHQELAVEVAIDEIIGDRVHTHAVVRVAGGNGLIATATGIYVATQGASHPVRG